MYSSLDNKGRVHPFGPVRASRRCVLQVAPLLAACSAIIDDHESSVILRELLKRCSSEKGAASSAYAFSIHSMTTSSAIAAAITADSLPADREPLHP